MKLYDSGEKLRREEIEKFENELNIILPNDYIDFILKNNGGTPEEDIVFDYVDFITSKELGTDIREFFIFYKEREGTYDDIVKVNNILHETGQLDKSYFVFADDSGGNIICMSIEGDHYGQIYFGDQELEDPETGHIVLSKVANSFIEFIQILYEM